MSRAPPCAQWLPWPTIADMGELIASLGRAGLDMAGNVTQEVVKGLLAQHVGQEVAVVAGSAAGAALKEVPTFVSQVRADRVRRATAMLDTAMHATGVAAEEFLEIVGRDEHHRYLLHRAVEAAAQAIGEEKIRTLAAALASGAIASDPADIDTAVVVIDAVSEIETIHLRVLGMLFDLPPDDPYTRANTMRPWAWKLQQLHDADSGLGHSLDAIVAKLRSLGMVDSFPSGILDYDDSRIRLTGFGVMCMEHLQRVAGDAKTARTS
jgi:hypothetical protein